MVKEHTYFLEFVWRQGRCSDRSVTAAGKMRSEVFGVSSISLAFLLV
jgi:hypothetical protein